MSENEEADSEEADSEEADSEEADAEEADAEEVDAEEADAEEADSEEADSEEADSEEADSEEADAEELVAAKRPPQNTTKWPYVIGAVIAASALYFAVIHRGGSASEVEGYLLGRAGEDIGAERLEDVEGRRVWRVDLVQLDGLDSLSEALVDFDRDGRYDERWEFFTDGRIRRHHSSQDDGRYDVVEMRSGDEWSPLDAPTVGGLPEDVEQAIGSAIAAVNENAQHPEDAEAVIEDGIRSQAEIWLLTQQGRSLNTPLERDARGGVPWHVDLYQDDGSTTITGALLDLDGDGHADQRWTYEGEERVLREVSTADDEVYDQSWEWTDEGWREVTRPNGGD